MHYIRSINDGTLTEEEYNKYVKGEIAKIKQNFKTLSEVGSYFMNSIMDESDVFNFKEQILEKINISDAPLIPVNASPRNEITLSLNMEEKIRNHFKLDYESIPQLIRTDW